VGTLLVCHDSILPSKRWSLHKSQGEPVAGGAVVADWLLSSLSVIAPMMAPTAHTMPNATRIIRGMAMMRPAVKPIRSARDI
jgi:hypothetical protein